MTFTAFPVPYGSLDSATQAVFRFGQDVQTGLTGTSLTLANAPVSGTLRLFKNGALLSSLSGYTVSGKTVTLSVAAVAGDEFEAFYHFRQN